MCALSFQELLKTTADISHQKELQEAISTMVTVLRYVNDVMHASSIIGFPVSLPSDVDCNLQQLTD